MRVQLRYWAHALAVGLVFFGAPASPACAQRKDDPHETPEVRRLVLTGLHSVVKHDLEQHIGTQASRCKNIVLTAFCLFSHSPTLIETHYLDRQEFERDVLRIRAYYWTRGFRDATVDTSIVRNANGVTVTFTVHENRPTLVRRVAIDYDSTLLAEKRIKKLALMRAGQPLDLDRLDSMRVFFINELWNRGYGDAMVDTALVVDDSVAYTADVHLRLIANRPTFVGPIVIQGLEHVSPQTVLNALSLHTGEPFRRNDRLESQRDLYESNLFRLVNIIVSDSGPPAQRDPIKRIQVQLSESKLRAGRYGLGFSNMEFVQAEGHFTSYNMFGGARRLDLDAAVGNLLAHNLAGHGFFQDPASLTAAPDVSKYLAPTWAVGADFRQPAFMHRPKDQVGLSGFAHRRSTTGIFVDRGYGGAATLTRQVRERAPVSLTYRFEINRVDASDVYFCVNYGVCDTLTITSLRSHRSLSPVSLTGFVDRADIPLDPTKGYTARIDLEHASTLTASDYGYHRAFLDVAAYTHRLEQVYAAHLRVGFVRAFGGGGPGQAGAGVLHPRKRFYAGGASSVRGYGENQLGPRLLTIDPAKLSAPIADGGSGCTLTADGLGECDPNRGTIGDGDFLPQPLGGTSLIEASVEWRFPTHIHRKLQAAVFLDGGVVGQSSLRTLVNIQSIARGSGAITPGAGLRYVSPVGPIRFDIGFNPKLTEDLPVVTEIIENGQRRIVPLGLTRRWASTGPSVLERLTLHFSIGQAY